MALVTKNNIIRKNIFFYCNSAGLILGTTSNYNNNPCNNKIYNNTFIKNGYNTNIKTGLETKCGIGFADYESNKSITGNSIINNLFHNNGKNKAFGFYKVDSSLQYFKGNWVESGDPLFENSLSLLSPDNQLPNFELKDSSPCIDKGVFLTRIISEDGFGKSFQVKDAGFFSNGFKVTCSDTIQLEKNKTTFVIKSINYKTREIIIDKNVSWSKNQGVFLVYKGSFPDIGACEHFTNLVTPNKNNIKIKFKKQKIKHYSVYDISGRKIKKLALNRYSKFDLVTSHKLSYCLPVSNIYIHVFKSNSQIHADLFSTIK